MNFRERLRGRRRRRERERRGRKTSMNAEVYNAALVGSWEKLLRHEDWRGQATPMGNNVLHVHVGVPADVRQTNMEFIRNVLDENVDEEMQSDLLWHENDKGEIPLHLAARFGRLGAVSEFLARAKAANEEEVRKMLMKTNKRKDTALHEAARRGYSRIVKLLVEADPSCLYEANDDEETPLYLAAESRSADCVAAILDSCASAALAYDHNGPCGRTVLHVLVQWKTPELMRRILSQDKTLVRLQDDEGLTPLHHVAAENKTEHLQVLLGYEDNTNSESAAYVTDNEGRTPLHVAALHLSWDSIKVLIRQHPDCIEIVDNRGQNVLHYVAKWACVTKFEYFLKLKFDLIKLLNDKDWNGNTPVHLFATNLPYLSCRCGDRVPDFISWVQNHLNLFNNQNLSAADIAASCKLEDEQIIFAKKVVPGPGRIAKKSELEGTRATLRELARRRATIRELEGGRATIREKHEKALVAFKEATQNWLVVAALVATVSFTAGITVPGGFDQSPGPDIGTAVMSKKTAFKAFLVSDTLAFTFSSFAIFLFFICAGSTKFSEVALLWDFAIVFSIFSIGAMVVAFETGVYSVIPHSHGLQIALFLISAIFFSFYVPFTLKSLYRGFWEGFKEGIQCPGVPPDYSPLPLGRTRVEAWMIERISKRMWRIQPNKTVLLLI